ncbi:MAG: hypothetical protein C5S48_07995 [Candidatus Methanogaster sp.]|nr:MAG: hypothetical protein C5S48_07995 [ANME-2 cluster archaeon]
MLSISEPHKTILADEIAFAREKMDSESDTRKKVYYYSAVPAMIQRIFNIGPAFDQQLLFMFTVLSASYNQTKVLIDRIMAGDHLVTPPENFFDKLSIYLHQLEDKIRNNEDTYLILEKIAVSAYLLDGNGYYLHQKGWIDLPE